MWEIVDLENFANVENFGCLGEIVELEKFVGIGDFESSMERGKIRNIVKFENFGLVENIRH